MLTSKRSPISVKKAPLTAMVFPMVFFIVGALFSGCANRSLTRYDALTPELQAFDYDKLAQAVATRKKLYPSRDGFLHQLDLGVAYHYAGKYDTSSIHLLKAAEILDGLYARSITGEAVSLLTNDNLRPYRSLPYETVLMHQFLAWNFLAQGKVDASLVETRRAQLLFNEWERTRGESGKFQDNGLFHYMSSLAYAAAGERDNAMISLFKSVKAFRSEGRLPDLIKASAIAQLRDAGRENDLLLLELTEETSLSHPQLPPTYDGSEIVLVGFAGQGPVLQETVFWGTWVKDGVLVYHYRNPQGDTVTQILPAPGLPPGEAHKAQQGKKTRSGTTFHIKFALPSMKKIPSRSAYFTARVEGSDASMRSEELVNTEKLMEQYLEDTRISTLTRTVVRVVLRTLAQEKTKSELATANPLLNLLLNLGTDALADQLEQADTRNCFLLPRSVQIIRIPITPGTHQIQAQVRGRAGEALETRTFTVEVGAREKKFLFFPSLQ